MADEEDYQNVGGATQCPPAFDAEDTTAEIPHPKRHVFILPSGERMADRLEECTFMGIKHPRHGAPQMVVINPTGELFEVQEHHRKFGQTWLIGEHVEPRSPLYLVTPLDATFIAIYALRGCVSGTLGATSLEELGASPQPSTGAPTGKFEDAYSLMARCPHLCLLPPICRDAIIQRFAAVADVVDANGVAVTDPTGTDVAGRFYRFSEDKCVEWLRNRYLRVLRAIGGCADSPTEGPSTPATPPVTSAGTVNLGLPPTMLPEKAAQLIAEYLDRANEPLVLMATDGKVDLARLRLEALAHRKSNNQMAAASRVAMGIDAVGIDDLSEPAEKKKRVEIKSASVKKLEKAGAPKGTPTLMAMFAKKAAAPAAPKTE